MTEKEKITKKLKENNIIAKVKITENRIDVKYDKDLMRAVELFPKMSIVYGFYN